MALENYIRDAQRCTRCSYCKWIPWKSMLNTDFAVGCPSVARYNWHAYSGGGKFNIALSFINGRLEYTDSFLDAIYRCHMDGSCDISCKVVQDIEPLQCMQELRIKCVQDGHMIPAHKAVIDSLWIEDNMMHASRADRGKWAERLSVKDIGKDKARVVYYAGCRYSFDEDLWPVAKAGIALLMNAGVDVGIMKQNEKCCGGRAYEMGYTGGLNENSKHLMETFKTAGVETLVTPCSDCYSAFKVLYDKIGSKLDIEVLHITQYIERLISEGKLKLTKSVPMTVTYHDPCHLGRLGEPWIHWEGKEAKVLGQLIVHDPPKKFRRGTNGIYETPRQILKSIPGLKLVEMYRIKEYAWCCGAGGGVKEAYPDFALWTASERLREANATGAEAIVSACPWCKRNFMDAAKETGDRIEVYDIVELIQKAI